MTSGRWVVRRSLLLGTLASVIASLLGALVVTVLLVVVLPTPEGTDAVVLKNVAVGGAYVVAAVAIVLGLIALVFGLLIMVFLARSIADPLKALRRALIALAEGDTSVRVPVFDSTEVGVLQTGFNQTSPRCRPPARCRPACAATAGCCRLGSAWRPGTSWRATSARPSGCSTP